MSHLYLFILHVLLFYDCHITHFTVLCHVCKCSSYWFYDCHISIYSNNFTVYMSNLYVGAMSYILTYANSAICTRRGKKQTEWVVRWKMWTAVLSVTLISCVTIIVSSSCFSHCDFRSLKIHTYFCTIQPFKWYTAKKQKHFNNLISMEHSLKLLWTVWDPAKICLNS